MYTHWQAKHAAQFIHGQRLSYLKFQALESKVRVSDCCFMHGNYILAT